MSNKEQIYDTEIAPLMDQIVKICQENKIAMLASFALPTEEDGSLVCSTALEEDGSLICSTALLGEVFDPQTHTK